MKTEKGKGYTCGAQFEIPSVRKTIREAMNDCVNSDHGLYKVTYKRIKIPKGKKK